MSGARIRANGAAPRQAARGDAGSRCVEAQMRRYDAAAVHEAPSAPEPALESGARVWKAAPRGRAPCRR